MSVTVISRPTSPLPNGELLVVNASENPNIYQFESDIFPTAETTKKQVGLIERDPVNGNVLVTTNPASGLTVGKYYVFQGGFYNGLFGRAVRQYSPSGDWEVDIQYISDDAQSIADGETYLLEYYERYSIGVEIFATLDSDHPDYFPPETAGRVSLVSRDGKPLLDVGPFIRPYLESDNLITTTTPDLVGHGAAVNGNRGQFCGYFIKYWENYDDGTGYRQNIDVIQDNFTGQGDSNIFMQKGAAQFRTPINRKNYNLAGLRWALFGFRPRLMSRFENIPFFYWSEKLPGQAINLVHNSITLIDQANTDDSAVNASLEFECTQGIAANTQYSRATLNVQLTYTALYQASITKNLELVLNEGYRQFVSDPPYTNEIPIENIYSKNIIRFISRGAGGTTLPGIPNGVYFRKICKTKSIILTWLNDLGGWDYWVFDEDKTEKMNIQNSKEVVKDIFIQGSDAWENSETLNDQLSLNSRNSISFTVSDLSKSDTVGLSQLKKSSKVFMYDDFTQETKVTVIPQKNSFTVYNDSKGLQSMSFEILLPSNVDISN